MLPPLRERGSDIRLLAEAYLEKLWSRPEQPVLSPHTLEILRAYDFPGNIRELVNQKIDKLDLIPGVLNRE